MLTDRLFAEKYTHRGPHHVMGIVYCVVSPAGTIWNVSYVLDGLCDVVSNRAALGRLAPFPQKKDETILSRSLTRPRPRALAARFHSACQAPSDLLGRLRVGHSHTPYHSPVTGRGGPSKHQRFPSRLQPAPSTDASFLAFSCFLVSPRGLMVVIVIRRTPTWDRMHSTFQERTSVTDAVSSTS